MTHMMKMTPKVRKNNPSQSLIARAIGAVAVLQLSREFVDIRRIKLRVYVFSERLELTRYVGRWAWTQQQRTPSSVLDL